MARFVVSAVVGIAAGIVGGPVVGFQAFAATYGLTGFLDPNQQVSGPRIDDLKGTTAEYGTPIPHVYGHPRVAGTIVWCSDKREIATTEEVGGKGGPSTDVTTYTYEIDLRIILTANQIVGVRRIWSNGKLIWSIADDADQATIDASNETNAWRRITVYTGASDQMPDPTEEAALGIENCPAYRGRGSVFIEGLNLGGSGFLPNLTFEVVRVGEAGPGVEVVLFRFDTDESDVGERAVTVAGSPTFGETSIDVFNGAARFDANEYVYTQQIGTVVGKPMTLEGWYYQTADLQSTDVNTFIEVRPVEGVGAHYLRVGWRNNGFEFYVEDDGIAYSYGVSPEGEWIFVRACYDPNTGVMNLFLDGDLVASGTSAFQPDAAQHEVVVGQQAAPNIADGRYMVLDDTRVTIGRVRSTASFAVPTAPLPYDPSESLTSDDEPLEDVLTDLANRAGVTSVDFSSCGGQFVRALAVTQVTPARGVMELLGNGALQDFVEGVAIKTVARGGASVATLDYEDLGASTGDLIEALPLKRLNDIELPAQFAITYVNVLNDYQKGTEYSDRLLGGATSIATSELAIGLTPTEAKRLADVRLLDAVAGISQIGPVNITRAWARLEPTDVVTLTGHDGSTFRARILKITDAGGLRTLECVMDDATVINSNAETDDDYESSSIVRALVGTNLELLDIPILRDADNDAGIYAAVTRATLEGEWPGAALFRGVNETGWSQVATYTDRTFIGLTTTSLGAWTGGYLFDEQNTVTVSGVGTLSNYTEDSILNGTADGYLIGSEVLYAKRATLVSTGVYTLAGLLRGRRGTEWAAAEGADTGTRVVLLRASGMRRVGFENGQLGAEFDFRAVTLGNTIGSADTESITPMGVGLKPFAPVHVEADDNGDGTYDVTWQRRTRLSCRFTGSLGINTPLGEASESYAVEVFDGASVTSTQTVAEESATVTASPGDVVRVYQVSAIVGRGYVAELTL